MGLDSCSIFGEMRALVKTACSDSEVSPPSPSYLSAKASVSWNHSHDATVDRDYSKILQVHLRVGYLLVMAIENMVVSYEALCVA